MAICRMIETGVTPEQYVQVVTQLGVNESNPPPGGKLHLAVRGEDGKIRIFEVWDSQEQAEAWGDKVRSVREELGIRGGPPVITYFEVQRLITV